MRTRPICACRRNEPRRSAGKGIMRVRVRLEWKVIGCPLKKNRKTRLAPLKSGERGLLFSSPLPTLRLTPLPSALRAARAHDAVLRMYPGLPLRFIKIHGDILVSYANKEICFISRPGNGLSYCCFQSEPNPKPMPGMETEWKDNSHSEQSEHREREGGGGGAVGRTQSVRNAQWEGGGKWRRMGDTE